METVLFSPTRIYDLASSSLLPIRDRVITVRIIAKRTLWRFWVSSQQYADSKGPLEAWHAEALTARWQSPQDIKSQFRSASILKNSPVVFNIGGNKYRLIVALDYIRQTLFIKFIGTHKQYNKVNAEEV